MSVLVRTHHTTVRVDGEEQDEIVMLLKTKYEDVQVIEEESTPVRDTEWYAEMRETETSGRNIYASRMKYQLTQKALGKLIGKSEQYISDLENNRRSPNRETAQKLGEALKRDWRKFI